MGSLTLALKTIYSTMIRAILDYGCMVYGSAAKSQLGKLERIQSQALRFVVELILPPQSQRYRWRWGKCRFI